ncbi:MAG: mechanosensitive ion channel domain-containing protein [Chitinophagales bacterium]
MNVIETVKEALVKRSIELVAILPDIIGGILLLLIAWLIAKIIYKVIYKVLVAVRIDSLKDKLQEIDLFSNLNFELSKTIAGGVYWLIMTVIILETSRAMGLESVADGISGFIAYIPILLSSMLFFIIGVFIANVIKEVIAAACDSMNIGAGRIISGFIFYFLVVMVAITAINQTGIDTEILSKNVTILIGSIFFAIALGYAIASKDLMANMLASFYSKGKFMAGQTIKVDGIEGKIIEMDSTSVILKSGDKKIVMPLSKLANATVEIL